jgi:hypothetical protein
MKLEKEKKWALGSEGVVVTVLTVVNLVVLIKYGRPFNKGHSLSGLLFLLGGAFVNFSTFLYHWNQEMNGNEADKKFAVVCKGFALYIEI